MTQDKIDNVEIAWMRLCVTVRSAHAADDTLMDAMMDMGWTLESLLNDCQAVVEKENGED